MKRVLIIGYVWPEPQSSAAGTRMMDLIQLFLRMQLSVTFATAALPSERKADLMSLGVNEKSIELNASSFDEWIAELQPDLVLFDRFFTEEQFGWRVQQVCPQALRILDTEDLHSLRDIRHQLLKKELLKKAQSELLDQTQKNQLGPASVSADALYRAMTSSDMVKREMAAIFRSDLSLIISEYELDLLKNYFSIPMQQLFYCPFFAQSALSNKDFPGFSDRKEFICIGNFLHQPNWDAVLWLKESLWPKIHAALPDAQLHIYGAYAPPKALQLTNPREGFLVKGWVEDAHQVMRGARVCLAPLRFGAGIKGKLIDAIYCGTPSVTTSIGVEGMTGGLPWAGAVADTADAFANAAVVLYQNAQLWQEKQTQGFAILQQHFGKQDYAAELISRLFALKENLVQERENNFVGQMLSHHQMKSTEYMGRWIEEKNKKIPPTASTPFLKGG